ncbi:sugar transferase [bacterium]|nr:sugar transferase [bacterium]
MTNVHKKIYLFLSDYLAVTGSFFIWSSLRISMGFFSEAGFWQLFRLSLFVFMFWFLLFAFFGHYRTWFTRSRTDEIFAVAKTVSIGIFIIFLMTMDVKYDIEHPITRSRTLILSYWLMMMVSVSAGRVLIISVRKKLLERGVGTRAALIVGTGEKATELSRQIAEAPGIGYRVQGFVALSPRDTAQIEDMPVLGDLGALPRLIHEREIREVLIGVEGHSEHVLESIIDACEGTDVGLKIIPDLYNVIIGQVKTNQLYGFPLIEILPQLMQPWEWTVKRIADILFSLFILVCFLPLWLVTAVAIKLDSRGPLLYNQKRVGMNGRVYTMFKFRSMVADAEKMTGPVWATWDDDRVTRFGRFMRRVRLDEIPQLINVIKGDMSWVGPRPERPHFVEKFKKEIPLYARRLRVRPGITGWAQIKGVYDQNIEHVKQKLAYDLFYLENMSLRMDLKIIISTLYIMMQFKGH